jgi:dTDP-glucose 4,6-dehydratase
MAIRYDAAIIGRPSTRRPRSTPAMRFLVIGSNSFSGASFIDHLLDRGYQVTGVSRSPERHPAFLPYRWGSRQSGFHFRQCDLNHDLDGLMKLVAEERPECVANFAALSMVGESWRHPDHWMMTNAVSMVRLHERLRGCDFVSRYVHVSTPEVYGSTGAVVSEDAPFNPSTPYAVSRAASDMSLRIFFSAYGFPVVFTRAATVFGPGQQLYRIVPRTILFLKLGRKLQLHGGGYAERSFIHIRDVADAMLKIALGGTNGETYHISTNHVVPVRDVVRMICERMGARFEDSVEAVNDRLGQDAAYRLDSTKARSEFGWTDQIGLEQGLDDTIRWVHRFLDDLKTQPFDYIHTP